METIIFSTKVLKEAQEKVEALNKRRVEETDLTWKVWLWTKTISELFIEVKKNQTRV